MYGDDPYVDEPFEGAGLPPSQSDGDGGWEFSGGPCAQICSLASQYRLVECVGLLEKEPPEPKAFGALPGCLESQTDFRVRCLSACRESLGE